MNLSNSLNLSKFTRECVRHTLSTLLDVSNDKLVVYLPQKYPTDICSSIYSYTRSFILFSTSKLLETRDVMPNKRVKHDVTRHL
jgi:hypothetical protein